MRCLPASSRDDRSAILERNREFLNKGCSGGNVPNLINVVMQLRKVCNHPFLIQVRPT
jgi:SNF2 family DNA or RNA helicase